MIDFALSIESNVEEQLDRLQEALGNLEGKTLSAVPGQDPNDGEMGVGADEGWPALVVDDGGADSDAAVGLLPATVAPTSKRKPGRKREPMSLSSRERDFLIDRETRGRKPNLKAYPDQAGHPTIGYGHEIQRGEDFSKGIDEAQARALLSKDIEAAMSEVNAALEVPLSQNEFDALVDFTFNEGGSTFTRSTLRKTINAGRVVKERMFTEYDKEGRPLHYSPGLHRRRVLEWNMFKKDEYGGNPRKPKRKP